MDTNSDQTINRSQQPTPVKEKQERGRKMWESRMKRKDLQIQLQVIENRIKHLNQEQQKCEKVSKITEEKSSPITSIRETHERFRQEKIDWKLMQDQEVNYRRKSLNKFRKTQRENIKEAKQRVIDKNRVNSLCVKAKTKANEALRLKVEENTRANLKMQANSLMQSEAYSKHKRSSSSMLMISRKESEYEGKLREEMSNAGEMMKKIEEMSKVEEVMVSDLLRSETLKNHNKVCHSACALLAEKATAQDTEKSMHSIV